MLIEILRHIVEFKKTQRMPRLRLLSFQRQKLGKVLLAASRTRHYSFLRDASLLARAQESLEALPVLERCDLQADAQAFRNPLIRGPMTPVKTSGSSGNPVEVSADADNIAWRIASGFAVTTEFGRSPRDLLVDIAARPHVMNPILARMGLFRNKTLSLFDSEEGNYDKLRLMKPDILGRHPSTMSLMAGINDRYGNPIRLKAVYCTGERLSPAVRSRISSSFACPVFDHYGTSETGSVAFECPEEHNLHVHPSCIVEIVSDSGKPLRSGTGEMLVTSLANMAMPLLRYKVGDRASWGADCPCGRTLPALGHIEGRSSDFIALPSGMAISSRFLDLLASIDGIPSHQVLQKSESLIVFRYSSEKEIPPLVSRKVSTLIKKGCRGESVAVEFERVGHIPQGRGGKTDTFIPLRRQHTLK